MRACVRTGDGRATAVAWVLAPENAAELPALLVRHLPHLSLSASAAAQAAVELQSPHSILKPGLPVNPDGMGVVLDLRRRYGTPPARLGDAGKYLDLSYYRAAVASLRPST